MIKKIKKWIIKTIPYPNSKMDIELSELNKSEPYCTLVATGDITLAYHFDKAVEPNSSFEPFINFRDIFKNNITLINLEAPITNSNDRFPNKTFTFKSSPSYVKYIKEASIDIVNLANNHIGDFGVKGIDETIQILFDNNIQYVGAGTNFENAREPKIIEKNNIKIAFLGYDDVFLKFLAENNKSGVAYISHNFEKEIKNAKNQADIVCVSIHFGTERMPSPSERQKNLATTAIDYGADIVIGHHPHTIQGFTKYQSKITNNYGIIFYSLGNFCFGGNNNPSDKDTFIPLLTIQKDGVKKVNIIPCKISSKENTNDFLPIIVCGNEKRRILYKLKKRNQYV